MMKKHHKFSELTEDFSPEKTAEIFQKTAQLKAEMNLYELQQALKLKQPELRQINQNINQYINHFRQIIESMGGELDITIHLSGEEIKINSFDEPIDLSS